MAVFLLQLILSFIAVAFNLLTRLILMASAHAIVQLTRISKAAENGGERVVELVRDAAGSCLEYLLVAVSQASKLLVSSIYDLARNGASRSWTAVMEAVSGSSDTAGTQAPGLHEEVMQAVTEMVSKIVTDFINNGKAAISYVNQNVFS